MIGVILVLDLKELLKDMILLKHLEYHGKNGVTLILPSLED